MKHRPAWRVAASLACFVLSVPFTFLLWLFVIPTIIFQAIAETLRVLAVAFDPPDDDEPYEDTKP